MQVGADRIHVSVIRPGMVPYGPGDRLTIPGMVNALQRGLYAHVDGGHQRVCLVQVDNLCEGMLLAAQRDGDSGEVFVLADEVVSWQQTGPRILLLLACIPSKTLKTCFVTAPGLGVRCGWLQSP